MQYANPVHRGYFADPFAFRHGDAWYAIGTGDVESGARGPGGDGELVFPMLRSTDLVEWEPLGRALERPAPSLGDTFWAPEIAFDRGLFYLYYSVGHDDRAHQLRVATSANPQGPYRDVGAPVIDPSTTPFAIDPHPFRDGEGQMYLYYARDFLDATPDARAGTALVVQPLEDMTRAIDEPHVVLRARWEWQRFERDRRMYGRTFDWHTLEGPNVVAHDGRYVCFYSGGRWDSDRYGVDYCVADRVLGPYADDACHDGPRVLRTIPGRVLGPGHNSIVRGPGDTDFIVYHAWDTDRRLRQMCIDPLVWTAGGPRCDGPSREPRSLAAPSRSGG